MNLIQEGESDHISFCSQSETLKSSVCLKRGLGIKIKIKRDKCGCNTSISHRVEGSVMQKYAYASMP